MIKEFLSYEIFIITHNVELGIELIFNFKMSDKYSEEQEI